MNLVKIQKKEIDIIKRLGIKEEILLINKKKNLYYLIREVNQIKIKEDLEGTKIKDKIQKIKIQFENKVYANLLNSFWNRKNYLVKLPYIKYFDEKDILTKARSIHMNVELLKFCKKEINELLDKKLIRPSKSPQSCAAFYVQNQAEIERGVPQLVINYKPLNKILQWIRYHIPNKRDLIKRLSAATIFSKFDMKSGFWQIQIHEDDKYKTAFTVLFGHYEWNVMPFGLKNTLSEFQNIMNKIFNPYYKFTIV